MQVRGEGPIPARLMIVGEAPGRDEEAAGAPFVGASGQELNRMLHEAGIMRSECYVTNVSRVRPPDNFIGHFIALKKKYISDKHFQLRDKWVTKEIIEGYKELLVEIEMVQPNLIITCGNLSMWALTGTWGVMKWRGSQLQAELPLSPLLRGQWNPRVVPTIHPAAVLREWASRALVVADLRRAKRFANARGPYENERQWRFQVGTRFEEVIATLHHLQSLLAAGVTWVDFDIETASGHIDCVGLSWSLLDSICIPLMSRRNRAGFWMEDEEAHLVYLLYKILTHTNVRVRWQNGLYDAQYVYRWWNFIPRHGQDTMIAQHSAFAALPKGLGFLGSMYADYYYYWKDEGKAVDVRIPEEQRWKYNCKDTVYTREVGEALTKTHASLGLTEVDAVQQSLFYPVLSAMTRGVLIIKSAREKLAMEIEEELSKRSAFLYNVLGHSINPGSPKQMQALFYEDLKQPVVYNRTVVAGRTVMRPSCDDEALNKICAREPLLKPVCNAIADIRTLEKWLGDFVLMPLDTDKRMRCSFNIAGDAKGKSAPYSYRLSSSKNAFGSGGNLQTIPSEKSKSAGKAVARGTMSFDLPNIRAMFGPDQGFTFFDMDLDRADLQVVVWEANDAMLKHALRIGADVHLLNVYSLDGVDPPPLEELVESHPRYADHRGPRKHKREFAKVFCHATNYVGSAKTVAAHTGRSVHEVDRAQKIWFATHPGIKLWHKRTEEQINKYHFVENRFGYKWFIFDRLEGLLPEAVAWVPQSTVGNLINRIWIKLFTEMPEVQTLLQVHDSLAGQFPTHLKQGTIEKMKTLTRIVIPYDDPLIIPTGIKTSEVSWGDCS